MTSNVWLLSSNLIQSIADWIFMPYVVAVLLCGGLFLTFRLGVVQVRRLPEAVRAIFARTSERTPGVLSPFQAFATALAASIGTGNIAGVATAIISGGPGALFWIWVYGFVATSTKFAEAVLGVHFRRLEQGVVLSGPMYYLRDGLKSPGLAWIYAFVAGIAAVASTPFTQPNSIAVAVHSVFGVPSWIVGIVVGVLTWLVIVGGITAIGRAMEKLVPVKVGLYVTGGAVVIVSFADRLPDVIALVIREAWTTQSAMGFGIFVAMRYGIARGIYANEAGFGSAAIVYGTARSTRPTEQGLQAVMEVFIVSFVTATISAMTILLSGVAEQSIAARQAGATFVTSTAAVAAAFNAAIPTVGGWIVAVCAFLFGYTTLIGWSYYGEQFFEYLLGRRVTLPYRWIYCLLIPFGAVLTPEVVWAWADLLNSLQIFPNMIGLVALSGLAARYAYDRAR
jgi:AGCS family alanine or glycine:cation symporter